MFKNATESGAILKDLHGDTNNAATWLSLASAQGSPALQAEVLSRAIATIPSSEELWVELINQKEKCEDRTGLFEIMRDALSLFSGNIALWRKMLAEFPSIEIFTAALRSIDNSIVWPMFLKYIMESNILPEERVRSCKHFLEFDASGLPNLVSLLLGGKHKEEAAELLMGVSPHPNFEIWDAVLSQNGNNRQLVEAALQNFPAMDGTLVVKLAHIYLKSEGFTAARKLLLHHIENPSSVAAFCELFSTVIDLYEYQIDITMKSQGQGGWDTTRLMSEYSNVLRKRPMLLSNIAISQYPNDVKLWLDRADLWKHRPHIAANIIETALSTFNAFQATNGDVSELYIKYAHLLTANGNDLEKACEPIDTALSKNYISLDAKTSLYAEKAIIQKNYGKPEFAIETLNGAIQQFPNNPRLWLPYLTVLAESSSPEVMPVFDKCCDDGIVTMEMTIVVAQSFAPASVERLNVYKKGLSKIPKRASLPLWSHCLMDCKNTATSDQPMRIDTLRELFTQAFETFSDSKRDYTEISLLYAETERAHPSGWLPFARKRILHILRGSVSRKLWEAYISTFDGDAEGKRGAFEEAISKLNDLDANYLALKLASFEEDQGNVERARYLYEYASQIVRTEESIKAWMSFEERHGTPQFDEGIKFVPAMEMES